MVLLQAPLKTLCLQILDRFSACALGLLVGVGMSPNGAPRTIKRGDGSDVSTVLRNIEQLGCVIVPKEQLEMGKEPEETENKSPTTWANQQSTRLVSDVDATVEHNER